MFEIPLTPVHLFAIFPVYFKFKSRIDPLALSISSTFFDLEPLYLLLIGAPDDHGILHSYSVTLLSSVFIVFIVYFAERHYENKLWATYSKLKLNPDRVKFALLSVYLTFLVGSLSHLFLDMLTHQSLPYIFYPVAFGNPFYGGQASIVVDVIVAAFAFGSVYLWLKLQKPNKTQIPKIRIN